MDHIINHCQSIYSMLQNTLQITLVNGLEKFLWKVIPKDHVSCQSLHELSLTDGHSILGQSLQKACQRKYHKRLHTYNK